MSQGQEANQSRAIVGAETSGLILLLLDEASAAVFLEACEEEETGIPVISDEPKENNGHVQAAHYPYYQSPSRTRRAIEGARHPSTNIKLGAFTLATSIGLGVGVAEFINYLQS